VIGQTIAHYKVTAKLGEGGMGEVYRATDTKLGRDVALKVLPAAFAQDAQRMARFQREAQVLASLNHPNIAAIYGLEHHNGTQALAMELVDGPTLAERLAQSPLPVEEVLPIAKQISEALEYAHEKGIVHRDLKPANIKITADGQVKVLDFGLAKALQDEPSSLDISNSPTLSVATTRAGIILGTAAYMSPEQARGKPVDRRADIWSFGVVLYEMLAGRQLFGGETASDVLARVITQEPDWDALPPNTPRRFRELLRRCLHKEARSRLRDIGDARLEIEAEIAAPSPPGGRPEVAASVSPLDALRQPAVLIGAGLLALVSSVLTWSFLPRTEAPSDGAAVRFDLPIPKDVTLIAWQARPIADISPDGSKIVFEGSAGGVRRLFLRSMDKAEPVPLAGTEAAASPFISPDGQWVGFDADGALKKIPLNGGAPIALAEVRTMGGASWGDDGRIVFSGDLSQGLFTIDSAGGTPRPLTERLIEKGESGHVWPHVLPGSKAALFTVELAGKSFDEARIELVTLADGKRRVLIEGGTGARYISTGHIMFGRLGALHAVPFDLQKMEITGTPVPLGESVAIHPGTGATNFSVSRGGSLITVTGDTGWMRTMVRVDRTGKTTPLLAEPRNYEAPRVSPDGTRIALYIHSSDDDVWLYDLERGTLTRMTFAFENQFPVWRPDGKGFVFTSSRAGPQNLFEESLDTSRPPELLVQSESDLTPHSLSPDGEWLAYSTDSGAGRNLNADIFVFSMKERKSQVFLQTPFVETEPEFSPDGKWIAYTSNQSGRDQVYVQPFPGPGPRMQVSTEGGNVPRWARNGSELFFVQDDKLVAVPVQRGASLQLGRPRVLFGGLQGYETFHLFYDVFPNGKEFVMVRSANPNPAPLQFHVVLNWFAELKRKEATEK